MNRFKLYILGLSMMTVLLGCNGDNPEIEKPKNKLTTATPLFKKLSKAESGFYYINELKENSKLNILSYEYLYNGSGVAIGDINKDGLPDIFMGGNLFGGRLFLNQGNLKFKQISEQAGVFQSGYTTGVCMVDINNDGYDDIYLCRSLTENPDDRRNVLLINNGDLTFTDKASEYGLDDPGFSTQANFFDYDNDGDLDMYLLNHRVDFKEALTLKVKTNDTGKEFAIKDTNQAFVSDKLYENNGKGHFNDVTKKAGLENRCFGLGVTVADINKDGWRDIYIANDYADKDQLMINNGNGTFTDQIDSYFGHMSKNSMGCDIADFNNDTELDIINLDMMSEDNYRQKQLKGGSPYDLYYMAVEYGLGHQVMRNTLQLNNGDGSYSEIGQMAGVSHTDWSWTPILADFDNDGNKDLFISNGYYRDVTDMDYIRYTSADLVQQAGGISNVDQMDLINNMKSNPQQNYLYQNNGDLTFSNKAYDWGLSDKTFSNGCAVADLDGDGDLDLIMNNLNQESFIYENLSNKTLSNHFVEFIPSENGCKVWLYAHDNVQYIDHTPYSGYLSNHQPLVHFGLGQNKQIDSVIVQWQNGNTRLLVSPEANKVHSIHPTDGVPCEAPSPLRKTSPLQMSRISGGLIHSSPYNDFKHEPLLTRKNSNRGPFTSKGDINNDGKLDFYVGGGASVPGRLFVQQSNGSFRMKQLAAFETDKAYSDGHSLFFDADGDGDKDLYVTSGGYQFPAGSKLYQDRLYLNDGKGNFEKTNLPEDTKNSFALVSLDLNNDSDEDIIVFGGAFPKRYPFSENSFVLINKNGKFQRDESILPTKDLGIVTDAQKIQIEGKEYIVLTREWNSIMLLQSVDGKLQDVSAKLGLSNTEGLWNSLTIADLNGDGKEDFVAGNHGLNDFFKAYQNSPATLFAADFDQNGSIEALPFYYYPDGKLHPTHSLEELFQQNPSFRKAFPRFNDYSKSSIQDFTTRISGRKNLELQLRIQTTSAFIFNNGRFEIQELPNIAQVSEVFGIGISDLNNDGVMDLVLAGNNFGVNVNQGRMDSGGVQFLPGKGSKSGHAIFDPLGYVLNHGEYRSVLTVDEKVIIIESNGSVWVLKKND